MAEPQPPAERPDSASDVDSDGYELQIALDQLAAGSTDALRIYLARKEGLDPNTVSIRSRPWEYQENSGSKLSYIGAMDDIEAPGEKDGLPNDKTKTPPRVILEDTKTLYKYVPLDPERRQFRLLRLAPPGESGIISQFRLETFCLDDAPPYLCLSYVWGDPDRFLGINCDGEMIPVTQNLFHALKACFNRHPNFWLWADGICINQEDLAERGSQVLFMGMIYQNAAMVLAHPGHYCYGPVEKKLENEEDASLEDRMDGLGVQDMLTFGVEPAQKADSRDFEQSIGVAGFELHSFDDAYSSQNAQSAISIMTFLTRIWSDSRRRKILSDKEWENIGLPDPDDDDEGQAIWGNLMSFWGQDWYFRTWVLQEVVLAKKVVVLYGEAAISLQAIMDFWSLASQHGLPRVLRIGPYADIFNMVRHLSPVSSFKELRGQRGDEDDKSDSEKKIKETTPETHSLLDLLCLSRNNLATDPRDKVYGLLGLTDDVVSQSIIPDYSDENTAANLFTKVATKIVFASQVSGLLQHAGIDQEVPDLPSWVPDWTRQSRSVLPSHLYRCMGATSAKATITEAYKKAKLMLRGAVISRVNQVGAAWKYYSHDRSASPFGGFATAPEVEIPPFNDEDARNFILTFASNTEEDLVGRYDEEGFGDALVRTLAVDCSWQGERIGPRTKCSATKALLPTSEELKDEEQPDSSAADEFFDGVVAFKRFYARGPDSEADLTAPGIRVHQTKIFMWLLDFDEDVEAELQGRMVPFTVSFQEAQRGRRFATLGTREPAKPDDKTDQAAKDMEKEHKKKRYATQALETHFMGSLPWNAEVEDYIVMLEGFRTPFVLRSVDGADNTSGEFTVVGDCYIHGVMNGELLRFADEVDEDLERKYLSLDDEGRHYAVRAPQGFVPFTEFTLV
ncbi:hypothetical protein CkaCkLH20_05978 [Colletotrichum karsti]|uniref:Heterokaryon incompatibility domain-containing protein n=1 Tax=Colletotrichum karsti TaxID=1095194 RepID=A0A9P6LKX4_9PEZI|nr:uncharacterized protein CkaCkLH20_05978 [Colletotrichum karsti]KAF9876570.1 hypothetical protein CkaCkLH20_05978 [Colletotrichum karsti]